MVITEVLLRPNGSATSRFRITILTAKRAMDRKAEPQRNEIYQFLCGIFAPSADFAVIIDVFNRNARKEPQKANAKKSIPLRNLRALRDLCGE